MSSIVVPILMLLLFVIAGIVAIGVMNRVDMWWWIALYWVILTVKNFIDFIVKVRGL